METTNLNELVEQIQGMGSKLRHLNDVRKSVNFVLDTHSDSAYINKDILVSVRESLKLEELKSKLEEKLDTLLNVIISAPNRSTKLFNNNTLISAGGLAVFIEGYTFNWEDVIISETSNAETIENITHLIISDHITFVVI